MYRIKREIYNKQSFMSSHCSVGGIGVCSQTAVAAAVFSLWTLPNIRSNRT